MVLVQSTMGIYDVSSSCLIQSIKMLICLRMAIPKTSLLKSSHVQIGFPMPFEMVKNEALAKAVSSINFIGN